MTLDEAIAHAREVAENARYNANTFIESDLINENCRKAKEECFECAEEHEQLASWLEELKERREADRWISVKERLPNRNGVYNVTRIIDGTAISDACYFDGQNTWHRDTGVNHGRPYLTDVIAWRYRPEPYKESEATNDKKENCN